MIFVDNRMQFIRNTLKLVLYVLGKMVDNIPFEIINFTRSIFL